MYKSLDPESWYFHINSEEGCSSHSPLPRVTWMLLRRGRIPLAVALYHNFGKFINAACPQMPIERCIRTSHLSQQHLLSLFFAHVHTHLSLWSSGMRISWERVVVWGREGTVLICQTAVRKEWWGSKCFRKGTSGLWLWYQRKGVGWCSLFSPPALPFQNKQRKDIIPLYGRAKGGDWPTTGGSGLIGLPLSLSAGSPQKKRNGNG